MDRLVALIVPVKGARTAIHLSRSVNKHANKSSPEIRTLSNLNSYLDQLKNKMMGPMNVTAEAAIVRSHTA